MKRKLQFDLGSVGKGSVVTVDCLRKDSHYASGFRVRVKTKTGEFRHLDASWVDKELAEKLTAHYSAPRTTYPKLADLMILIAQDNGMTLRRDPPLAEVTEDLAELELQASRLMATHMEDEFCTGEQTLAKDNPTPPLSKRMLRWQIPRSFL